MLGALTSLGSAVSTCRAYGPDLRTGYLATQIAKGIVPGYAAAAIVKAAEHPGPLACYLVPGSARPLIGLPTALPDWLADRAEQRATIGS